MKYTLNYLVVFAFVLGLLLNSCSESESNPFSAKDPDLAEMVSVDRFSETAAALMLRTADNGMPAANEAVNFDQEPFITQSLGPNGQVVRYYNFDVQPLAPAPIYILKKAGEENAVEGQLNIIDVIPGEQSYSDFWQMYFVTVPDNYVANAVTSFQEIIDHGFVVEKANAVVNCPVVPFGSTASENVSGQANVLHSGWYKGKIVHYFSFEEKDLVTDTLGLVPRSPIYVTFNENPDPNNANSGPASGFVTETGTKQTHNVIATIPSNASYSPLWSVNVYDNADFLNVSDLPSVENANILMENAMYVNCPVVYVE